MKNPKFPEKPKLDEYHTENNVGLRNIALVIMYVADVWAHVRLKEIEHDFDSFGR